MASVGSKVKSKNKQGCHPVTLLSLIYYFTVTRLSLASLKLFWDINKFENFSIFSPYLARHSGSYNLQQSAACNNLDKVTSI